MKILRPTLARRGNELQISARVERGGLGAGTLWFRFPAEVEGEVSLEADPFVVALLLVAMQAREPIEVEGSLSARLFQGLARYQEMFHAWYPDRFHVVEVRPLGGLRAPGAGGPEARGVACAFSGGVDSFYTFLKLRERQGPRRLTHALFMAGFDMPLSLKASIRELTDSYGALVASQGIRWVCGSTNVREWVNTVDWTNAHGQALAASALFFERSWGRFYVPSSYSRGAYPRWGTHPELDGLLSTESMRLIHHGARVNRVGKLETVARAPESHSRLRVCWIQDIGLRNCGRCEKCVRTMAALGIVGALGRYTTFPDAAPGARRLPMRTGQSRIFARELIREALARGRIGIAAELAYALARREVFRASGRLKKTAGRVIFR